MKRIIVLSLLILGLASAVFGVNTADAEQQAQNIGLNQPIIVQNPGDSMNKRYHIYLCEPGVLQINLTFDPKDRYIVTLHSINADGILEKRYEMGCSFYGETATGVYTEQSDRMRLPVGSYFIDVRDNNGWGWYNEGRPFTLLPIYSPEPGNQYEKEFNDKAREAMFIEPNKEIIGNLSSYSDEDYYHLHVMKPGTLQVKFSFDTESWYQADLLEVDSGGGLKTLDSMWAGMHGEAVFNVSTKYSGEVQVNPGDYYLRIYPSQGTFSLSPDNRTDKDYYLTILYNPT